MQNIISKLLIDLNNLLVKELSIHSVSYKFDLCSEIMRDNSIKVKIERTKYYYFDEQLNEVYQRWRSISFENYRERLAVFREYLELKDIKPKDENTVERIEPSLFEFVDPYIIAYLNPSVENEKLIIDLVKTYGLEHI